MSEEPKNGQPSEKPTPERVEAYRHWWRSLIGGFVCVGIGCYDEWVFGHNAGFTTSLDELLVIAGVLLIAGAPEAVEKMLGPKEIKSPPEEKKDFPNRS
jgi:hypothetical protein